MSFNINMFSISLFKHNTFSQHHSFLVHHLRAILTLLRRLITPSSRTETLPRTKQHLENSSEDFRNTIPRGAWDSHMHVVEPSIYPLAKGAVYCPDTYTLEQALQFEASVALDNVVLVQPSIYGNDNSCMLDALRSLGPRRGRAIVGFEPQTISLKTLKEWDALGVRGVRINFSSVGKTVDTKGLRRLLLRYADDCRPLGWVIQVYMPMAMIALLEPIIPELGVPVCIDHMGHPRLDEMTSGDPYEMHGFQSLINLLREGNTFVKLSAPYRLSSEADHCDLEPVARELLRVAGKNRVVFATDWPHTRFEGLDIRPWMETVLDWCDDDEMLVERLFKENAEDLWKVQSGVCT